MAGKLSRWESELWSYVSNGDGERCPLYSHCQVRRGGGWCPDEDREEFNRLLDSERFSFSSCDFIKCVECGRVFELVEMLARKYLKRGRVHHPPVPTELVLLTDEQHTIETRLLPLKAYHGAIWRLREGWVIQLKDDDAADLNRFTLFHEVFHILAHCRATPATPVFRKRGARRGSFNELLADYFAMCILMPREWTKKKWAEVKDLDRMVQIFDVPKSAVAIRLKYLGLI